MHVYSMHFYVTTHALLERVQLACCGGWLQSIVQHMADGQSLHDGVQRP